MTLISQREFGRRNGVSGEAIRKAVRAGRIPSVDGKIDPAQAQAAWDVARDPARAGRSQPRESPSVPKTPPQQHRSAGDPPQSAPASFPSGFGGHSFSEVKTRREQVLLARDQVELKRLLGELVDANQVRREIDSMIYNVKSKLLALGHKLAPRLAVENDAARCKEIVDDEIRQILTDLAASGGQQ